MVLEFYLKGLVFSAILMIVISGIYLFAFLVRNTDKTKSERRNRILDVILVNLLTIPILSFAILGILIILRVRGV